MQLVSGSKFKRAQGKLLQARHLLEFLDGMLQRVLAAAPSVTHPLTARREDRPSALLIVTSDAGLAGAYNTNLLQLADSELRRDSARTTQVSVIGKRGHRAVTKRGVAVADAYLDLAGRPDLGRIDSIGAALMARFLRGEIGSARLLYATFVSPTVSRPTVTLWLPIQLDQAARPLGRSATGAALEYLFEPSPQAVFEDLLPRWALATFRLALLEAFTSEHGARMIAMKHATDNAQELLGGLTRQRNKIRQASITRELSEIVGTAEALK
jgi:F-type H+-transporting ATPase subunit gamma